MLQRLKLQNVGPAPSLDIEFSSRVNLITGDNGLGKSFLLDVAWWALTSNWEHRQADPDQNAAEATIEFSVRERSEEVAFRAVSHFDRSRQKWERPHGIIPASAIVIHARAEGGISVWDPARNFGVATIRAIRQMNPDRIPAYVFDRDEIWDGKFPKKGSSVDRSRPICNGLIADWAFWQNDEGGVEFPQLKAVLSRLSPASFEPLQPGPLTEAGIEDARRMPTLHMPYGQNVPLVNASAAMQRIIALAYIFVWTWREHLRVSKIRNQSPVKEIVFLIDEVEAHLHPAWQRRILRALMDVTKALMDSDRVQVQIIAVTHSPLVLASMEPVFDPARDSLWKFDLVDKADGHREVLLAKDTWHRRGDASAWLESDVFDLRAARSEEAENAMRDARKFMQVDQPDKPAFDRIYLALQQSLPGMDPFWIEWRAWGFRHKLLDGQSP